MSDKKPSPAAIRDPLCFTCKHFDWDSEEYACKAFPEEIPDAILYFQHDHTKPYPGDNGILYERSSPPPELPKGRRPAWT